MAERTNLVSNNELDEFIKEDEKSCYNCVKQLECPHDIKAFRPNTSECNEYKED